MSKVIYIICIETIFIIFAFIYQNRYISKYKKFNFIYCIGNIMFTNFMLLGFINNDFINIFQYSTCVTVYLVELTMYFLYYEVFVSK